MRVPEFGVSLWRLRSDPIIPQSDADPTRKRGILVFRQFPATILSACAGKPILDVINVPVTRERYDATDIISHAFWDDEAQVSVFEIERVKSAQHEHK